MSPLTIRICTTILLYGALLLMPWWCTVILLILATSYFPLYLEVLCFGLFFDTLYVSSYHAPYTWLTSAALLLVVVFFVKRRIRV